jgi:hypothetical protein
MSQAYVDAVLPGIIQGVEVAAELAEVIDEAWEDKQVTS